MVEPIRVCATYKPSFGQGVSAGLTLEDFQDLYQADSFYHWFGLDNPLMYAAHKAAGGMTSIYRQIGIGCEALFRQILQDELGLSPADAKWSYSVPIANNKSKTLYLDGRILLDKLLDPEKEKRFRQWLTLVGSKVGVGKEILQALQGAVFEVRQGYKSKDSKRQNADIANAATAYSQGYLPCVALMSSQMDETLITRYTSERWVILVGRRGGDVTNSSYAFLRDIVGYDLASFFERHSSTLKSEVEVVLAALLSADGAARMVKTAE